MPEIEIPNPVTGFWFLIAAAILAVLLGVVAHVRHGPRWRCECGERFATEAELDEHRAWLGLCAEHSNGHTCKRAGHHTGEHRCACGMEWS